MERRNTVIHLRTGDRGVDAEVEAWLKRHSLVVQSCADVYEACVYALTRPEEEPGLVLIGVDWIAPDELGIVDYLREIWPDVTVVLYGRPPSGARDPGFGVKRFESASAISGMLNKPPDALLTSRKDEFREAQARALDSEFDERPLFDPDDFESAEAHEPPPPIIRTSDAAGLINTMAAPAPEPIAETKRETSVPLKRVILTQEELTALLDDEEK